MEDARSKARAALRESDNACEFGRKPPPPPEMMARLPGDRRSPVVKGVGVGVGSAVDWPHAEFFFYPSPFSAPRTSNPFSLNTFHP